MQYTKHKQLVLKILLQFVTFFKFLEKPLKQSKKNFKLRFYKALQMMTDDESFHEHEREVLKDALRYDTIHIHKIY